MSKVKPLTFSWRARPPGVEFFSKTVTSQPCLARWVAAERPEKPAPMMTICFSMPGFGFSRGERRLIYQTATIINIVGSQACRAKFPSYCNFCQGILCDGYWSSSPTDTLPTATATATAPSTRNSLRRILVLLANRDFANCFCHCHCELPGSPKSRQPEVPE
jgi:hypothetical protein